MKNYLGFTLIEVIIFIVVSGLLASTILMAVVNINLKTPDVNELIIANQTAKRCMEWFIGQRALNGYTALSCPSSTVPSFCVAPSGYSISVSISCTTLSGDTNYKTISVTVSGKSDANLSTLIANY